MGKGKSRVTAVSKIHTVLTCAAAAGANECERAGLEDGGAPEHRQEKLGIVVYRAKVRVVRIVTRFR